VLILIAGMLLLLTMMIIISIGNALIAVGKTQKNIRGSIEMVDESIVDDGIVYSSDKVKRVNDLLRFCTEKSIKNDFKNWFVGLEALHADSNPELSKEKSGKFDYWMSRAARCIKDSSGLNLKYVRPALLKADGILREGIRKRMEKKDGGNHTGDIT